MVDSGTYTPEAIARRLAIAQQLLDTSKQKPITHWAEGLNELAKGAVGGYQFNKAEGLERKAKADSAAAIAQALGIQMPAAAPSASTDTSPIAKIASLFSGDGDTSAPKPPAPIPPAGGGGDFGSAIAGIESGGRYDALGPKTKTGDQAHGKYQVMGANVGPWTKEILGKEMSPQEFLASPEAQDAVFKGKFGQYAQKYGPEGAARAWFAGEGGMNNLDAKDQLGTSVGQYGRKFAQAAGPTAFAGSPGAPQTPAPTPGATPAPTTAAAPAPAMDSNKAMIAKLLANPATQDIGQGLALKMLAQENSPTDDIKNYEYAKRQGFQGSYTEFLQRKRAGGGEYGLQPIWGVDETGNPAIAQLGKSGAAVQTKLPQGFKPAKDPIKVDAGTEFILLDPQTRQPIGRIPKDIAGKEAAEVTGKKTGEAKFDLPRVEQNAQAALDTIKQIREHPGKEYGVGVAGVLPGIPGTKQKDFVSLVDQAKGKAFLEAFNSLKGGGQITEVEGKKATDAIARLDRTQSKEGFDKALSDLESIIQIGVARARNQAGSGAAGAAPEAAPKVRRFNPETGKIE